VAAVISRKASGWGREQRLESARGGPSRDARLESLSEPSFGVPPIEAKTSGSSDDVSSGWRIPSRRLRPFRARARCARPRCANPGTIRFASFSNISFAAWQASPCRSSRDPRAKGVHPPRPETEETSPKTSRAARFRTIARPRPIAAGSPAIHGFPSRALRGVERGFVRAASPDRVTPRRSDPKRRERCCLRVPIDALFSAPHRARRAPASKRCHGREPSSRASHAPGPSFRFGAHENSRPRAMSAGLPNPRIGPSSCPAEQQRIDEPRAHLPAARRRADRSFAALHITVEISHPRSDGSFTGQRKRAPRLLPEEGFVGAVGGRRSSLPASCTRRRPRRGKRVSRIPASLLPGRRGYGNVAAARLPSRRRLMPSSNPFAPRDRNRTST